jgi:hypothetical protein
MDEKIVIKNLKVEYVSRKTDNYNNNQVYFKIKDMKPIENKFPSTNETNNLKLPYFKVKENRYLLKDN